MNDVSLLLVGIGGYGENYIKELMTRDIPGVFLAAVADPFLDRSPWKASVLERGIPVFRTPAEFYAAGGTADLVVISSPIHTHYDYIIAALEHGSDVLCEKPVAISLELMDDLIERERKSGRFVAVGYQLCFSKDVRAMKADVLSGLYGSPVRMKSLRLMRRGDQYYARNGWAGKLSCHGEHVFDSPVSNACAHQIQNMLYLLGASSETTSDVTAVEGELWKGRPSIENYDAAALRIHSDTGVELLYYTAHCLDEKKVGPMGVYEFENGTIVNQDDSFVGTLADGTVRDYSLCAKGERMQKLYDAIECVRTGMRPACSLVTARAHVKCVMLAQRLPVLLRYDAEKKTADGDGYFAIPDLARTYLRSYENWRLPREL